MIIVISLLIFLLVSTGEADAITVEEYLGGQVKEANIVQRGSNALVPLKRIPVGGVPGIVVGLAAAYILQQGDEAMEQLRIQAGAGNHSGLPNPSGWVDSNTPPNTASIGFGPPQYCTGGSPTTETQPGSCVGVSHTSVTAAAQALCVSSGFSGGSPHGVTDTLWGAVCTGGYTFNAVKPIYRPSGCPTGYQMVEGVGCTLTDSPPAKWPSDGVPTITTTPTGFNVHPRDPDTSPSTPSDTITTVSTNAEGEQVVTTYTARPDGGVDVRVLTQFNSGEGTSGVNDYRTTINQAGNVSNTSNYNTYNTTITDYAGPIASPGTGQQPVSLELPDDYARENTLQSVNNNTETMTLQLGEMRDFMKEAPPSEPVPDTVIPTDDVQIPTTLDANRFELPTTCPTIQNFQAMGRTYDLNLGPMCDLADMLRPLLLALAGLVAFRLLIL